MKSAVYIFLHNILLVIGQMCTTYNNLQDRSFGRHVISVPFFNTSTPGPMACAAQCMLRSRCKSFNYKQEECTLFPYGRSSSEFTSVLDSTYVFSDISGWPQKLITSCAHHLCPENSRCESIPPNRSRCVITEVTNCAEVLECNSDSVDGEYWIYLKEFQYHRVRIYCHGMNTTQPDEFITLVNPNSGNYPHLKNYQCKGEEASTRAKSGTTTFNKIRINLVTLSVNITDKTFASGTAAALGDYGSAGDCYAEHFEGVQSPCGPVGTFTIDLQNTGFKLQAGQEWKTGGWKPFGNVSWVSEAVVQLNCGGWCGWCTPDEKFLLSVNKDEEVYSSLSAASVICV